MIDDTIVTVLGSAAAVGGIGYIANVGYHLFQAAVRQERINDYGITDLIGGVGILRGADMMLSAGMGAEATTAAASKAIESFAENDPRERLTAEKDYHLHKAVNPFYKI